MSVLFFILLAIGQAFGIGYALAVDRLTWGWRNDESADLSMNYSALSMMGLLTFLLLVAFFPINGTLTGLFCLLIWVSSAALVQTRQYRIRFRAAFYGAAMQLWFFFLALILFAWIAEALISVVVFNILNKVPGDLDQMGWAFNFMLLSAIVGHVMLTFLRPQLISGWQQINSRKFW